MPAQATPRARQSTCIAIAGRAVLIEGPPGAGKSSLALSLIDRGAELVGDDGVLLSACRGVVLASPHPNTRGLMEVRNLGLLRFPCRPSAPVSLLVTLDEAAPRFIEAADTVVIEGIGLPHVRLWPGGAVLPIKVELALDRFGLAVG